MYRKSPSSHESGLPPAIIIGGELNGLGVCRSLGKTVPTYVVDRKRRNAAMWSRYANPIKTSTLHGPKFIETLRRLSLLGDRPVLIVTDEMALLSISERRSEIDSLFRIHLPSHEMVMMMHDKARFHEFATEHNLPVPAAEIFQDGSDLGRMQKLRLPLVIKPADKRFYHLDHVPRLIIASDRQVAETAARELIEATGEVIVQECISGPDTDIYFCLWYCVGNYQIIFTGQKLASSPPGSGSTAICTQAAPNVRGILEGITRGFLSLVEYEGFGGIEYKWDAGSERFIIIEPTVGRTDWQEEICALAGINIPLRGYYHECGLPDPISEPAETTSPVIWQASYAERLKLGRGVLPRKAAVIDGYWRMDDPMPALVNYPVEIAWSFPKIAKRMAGMLGLFSATG